MHLAAGESVPDIGCGTGTLAIVTKDQVGADGTVCRIDWCWRWLSDEQPSTLAWRGYLSTKLIAELLGVAASKWWVRRC